MKVRTKKNKRKKSLALPPCLPDIIGDVNTEKTYINFADCLEEYFEKTQLKKFTIKAKEHN